MVVDRSNYTFFLNRYNKRNLLHVGMVLDNIEAIFEFDPCTNRGTNYHVNPRFPVQDVTRQQFETLILGPT